MAKLHYLLGPLGTPISPFLTSAEATSRTFLQYSPLHSTVQSPLSQFRDLNYRLTNTLSPLLLISPDSPCPTSNIIASKGMAQLLRLFPRLLSRAVIGYHSSNFITCCENAYVLAAEQVDSFAYLKKQLTHTTLIEPSSLHIPRVHKQVTRKTNKGKLKQQRRQRH